MFNNFFVGKRILITGVAGVKGTWLAQLLLEAGSSVIGVDLQRPADDSNFAASNLHKRIQFIQGDINDQPLMQRLIASVDGVFNLAAVTLVGEARRNPLQTYRSNTMGVATLLEVLRLSTGKKYAVFVTTDKVYKPKAGEVWFEADPLFASDPYPVSKACAEEIIADYFRTYLQESDRSRGEKRIGVGRAGNVLLGGDPYSSRRTNGAGHLHVDCFEALAEGRSPELYTPAFTRPYTYGLDVLTGYMALMSRLDAPDVNGQAFNFGPHERYGIENGLIASKICELWGNGIHWQSSRPRSEPFEKQSMDWSKAQSRLDWLPAYTIDETLRDITRWYRAWAKAGMKLSAGSMLTLNQTLIAEYRQAAAGKSIGWAEED